MLRTVITAFTLFMSSSVALGQSAGSTSLQSFPPDSVINATLPDKPDSLQIRTYLDTSWELKFSDPGKSIAYADTALLLARFFNNRTAEADALNNTGVVHSIHGDQATALRYFLAVLEVRTSAGDLPGIAKIQNNLGILYKQLGDTLRSLEYHRQSLATKRDLGDQRGIARSLNNIGEVLLMQNKTAEAEEVFLESAAFHQVVNDSLGMAASFHNLGELYRLQGNNESALSFLNRSLLIEEQLGNLQGLGISHMDIAILYGIEGDLEQARFHFSESEYYFRETGNLPGLRDVYSQRTLLEESDGSLNEALRYNRMLTAINDSLSGLARMKMIEDLSLEYETALKDQELELSRISLNTQERYNNILLGISLLLTLSIGFLGWLYYKNRQTNRELREARAVAEEARDMKSRFISLVSHEIRTPLNAVIGLSHILYDEEKETEKKDKLATLRFSAQNLLSLINEVLQYEKVMAGKLNSISRNFNLKKLVHDISSSLRYTLENPEVRLISDTDDDIPDVLNGDPYILTQIINNLLGNSLKFTDKGHVSISARLYIEENESEGAGTTGPEADELTVIFEIEDTGSGISDDKMQRLYERFTQGDNVAGKISGSGLGLSITRKLIDQLGGRIEVESEVGKGTLFRVILPYSQAVHIPVDEHAETDIPEEHYSLEGFRILLAEDNEANIVVARHILIKWQADIQVARNGLQALELFNAHHFDVILMDLQMPLMDGYEATSAIRSNSDPVKAGTPVIAFSASSATEEADETRLSDFSGVLAKPFDPQQLYRIVAQFRPGKQEK